MHPLNYLRLKSNPPPEIPPSGNVDIFHDVTTGTIRKRDSSGNETVIGGAADAVTLSDAQTITGVKTFEATTSFTAPVIFEDGVEFGAATTFTFHASAVTDMRAALGLTTDGSVTLGSVTALGFTTSGTVSAGRVTASTGDDGTSAVNGVATEDLAVAGSFHGQTASAAILELRGVSDDAYVFGNGTWQLPTSFRTGLLAALGITTYADETAANAAEAVDVVYYNTATGKVQRTTA